MLKGIYSKASDILQGLEPPYRKASDLAHRNGDKVAVCTAATCRFLSEAPPLNCVDRGGGKHTKSHMAFYMLNSRKLRLSKPALQRLESFDLLWSMVAYRYSAASLRLRFNAARAAAARAEHCFRSVTTVLHFRAASLHRPFDQRQRALQVVRRIGTVRCATAATAPIATTPRHGTTACSSWAATFPQSRYFHRVGISQTPVGRGITSPRIPLP